MSTTHIRIGVPQIYWAPVRPHWNKGPDLFFYPEDVEESVEEEYKAITPTTGGVSFEETWTKSEPPRMTVRFKALGTLDACLPRHGDLVALDIYMPQDGLGHTEIRRTKKAEIEFVKHSMSAATPEIWEYEIGFYKMNWYSTDHHCNEHGHSECHGEVIIDPDTSSPFSISY